MTLHPQTVIQEENRPPHPSGQHGQHTDSFRGTGRYSKNPQMHLQRDVANQKVVQSLVAANGNLPQPSSQWHPVPSPGVWPQLPGPLRLHRGCTRQGAIWLGFLVSWVWPTGTLAGAGGRTAVTSVCKRQTLSEHAATLSPPMLGVKFSRLRHTLGL